ncbi:MAG TPA: recombinase family protein [Candidatus Paceibacterota bacterium]|nr:recombinase family protein [Verrucomicrobiota bacterium]HSA09873.1 recombinase family protein [Candidatus Paceibacterota bacterium]
MKTAISYLRFSSKQQSRTDSYRRQIEATERFCREHNLELLDRLEDLGVSAWTGKNLSDESALGRFLRLVEAGKIPKQTVLIVENLDRLSRAKILDALHLFTSIIKKGVEIVTTMDGKWYSEQSITENPTDLMISIIYLTRGNNESETKSVRVKQSWIQKHEKVKRGEFSKFACPSWLAHNGSKYSLIVPHANAVRLIFALYNGGLGVYSLIKELYRRKVKPFTKSKAWRPVFIHRLLQNPAVIGTCETVSPPQPNYYPAVVSEEQYYKAIARRKQNQNFRGKTGAKEINIYGGICKCWKCGASMVKYSCKGRGEDPKHYTFLVCSNSKVGKCNYEFTPFDKFNDSFLHILNMANFAKLIFASEPEIEDTSEAIRGKLVEVQASIDRVTDAIVKTDSPALVARLAQLELDRKQIEKEYETAKAEAFSKTDVRQDYKEIMTQMSGALKNNPFRLRLRNLMRRHLAKIVVKADAYTVHFKECTDSIQIALNGDGFEMAYWDEVEVFPYRAELKAA